MMLSLMCIQDYFCAFRVYPRTDIYTCASLLLTKDFNVQENGAGSTSKSVYLIPKPMQELMRSDKDERLKLVAAGPYCVHINV